MTNKERGNEREGHGADVEARGEHALCVAHELELLQRADDEARAARLSIGRPGLAASAPRDEAKVGHGEDECEEAWAQHRGEEKIHRLRAVRCKHIVRAHHEEEEDAQGSGNEQTEDALQGLGSARCPRRRTCWSDRPQQLFASSGVCVSGDGAITAAHP